jgi:DNA-directed RNA polymerase specialized sigma24 family protein
MPARGSHNSLPETFARALHPTVVYIHNGRNAWTNRISHWPPAAEKVIHALRSLPEDYQRPLSLRYLAGLDYETVSQQLGLTNGSLRGLLHRGLEMLREKMKQKV